LLFGLRMRRYSPNIAIGAEASPVIGRVTGAKVPDPVEVAPHTLGDLEGTGLEALAGTEGDKFHHQAPILECQEGVVRLEWLGELDTELVLVPTPPVAPQSRSRRTPSFAALTRGQSPPNSPPPT
jgi:hypothetical protein